MPSAKLIQKLKPALQNPLPPEQDGILLCLDSDNVTGDNAKYMKMYNRLARWYDFGERWIARLRYGNSINEMRRSLMDELEWRQDCTALYVSIGTGTDLNHLPADIDLSALDLTGADLSLGMLARCRDVWRKKAAGLDLVHCNAEDLPFADNMFDVVFHVGGINFFSDNKKPSTKCCALPSPAPKS
ncbi:methyltransferase domain protein [Neisseria sp. HMSC06F02]|nr:methyltransferase domain protein [Neisseria sp. HMSC06F02]